MACCRTLDFEFSEARYLEAHLWACAGGPTWSRGNCGDVALSRAEVAARMASAIEFETEVRPHAIEKSKQGDLFLTADALKGDLTKPVRRRYHLRED